MALPQDETTTEKPSIDYEALGLEPVSDEELFGSSIGATEPQKEPAAIDYESLGLEPVSEEQLFGFTPITPEPKEAPSDSDVLRGLEVSMRQIPQLAYGVAGLVGATSEQITGYGEALRDWGFRGYKEWEDSIEPISKETDDVTVAWQRAQEGDIGALVDWAQYGIGYGLGQLGETAAVAVLGGLAGAAAGAPAGGVGAAPTAAGGAIAAAASKQGFKALAKNLVEKAIASQAEKIAIREAEKKGVKLAGEQLAKEASQAAIKRQAAKEIGSDVAIFGNAIGMQLGSIYGEAESKAKAEGRDLTGYDLARVWGTGLATGGIEGVVDKFGLDLLRGKLSAALPEGRLAGAAIAGGVGTLGEAGTEAIQTVGERIGAGKDILSDEAINEYINAAALGGISGGGIGGVGGFISGNPRENAAAKAKVSAEASKTIAPATSDEVAKQADAVINEVAQETPDQRVARLQQEAKAAAGITLEEEPVAPTLTTTLQPDIVSPLGKIGDEFSSINSENRKKTEEFINGLEDGDYQVFDDNGEKNGVAKVKTNKSGKKVVEYVTDTGEFIGDAKSLIPELNFARFTDATGKEGFSRGSLQKITKEEATQPPAPEAAPTPEIAQAAQTRITEREGQAVTLPEEPTGNRVEAAAYQAPDGTVYYGPSHLDAMGKALDAGKIEQAEIDAKQETTARETPEFGFATNADPFVTRDQAETIARQSGQITVEQPATGKLHSNEVSLDAFAQPVVPTPTAAPVTPEVAPVTPTAEVAPTVTPRPTVDVEALSPNAKRANRILTNTGVDPETAAFVAQQYQDEIADLGGEELRAFILDKFEENGGVIPAQMRYSEDQEYYEMAFGIGPEEAATLVENAKAQNAQMAQAELEQNKQWRRKDEKAIQAQQGVAVAQPEAQAIPVPTGEVPPSPAIEGRRVPAAAQARVAQPTLPSTPRFAPLPQSRASAILQQAREARRNAPRNRRSSLEPKETIGKTARQALREAARMNLTPIIEFDKNDFRMQDVAAVLAEANLPDLDTEKIVSLSSLGRRGRAVRTYGRKIGVPSTRPTTMATLVHEVGHTLTATQIREYSKRISGKSGRAYIDGLRKAINDKATPEPIARIFSLYISTLDQLGIMDQYGGSKGLAGTRHPDMSVNRARKLQEGGQLRNDLDSNALYGLANVDEFIAQTFSSNSMRELLKTIKAPESNRSIWNEFVSAIKSILNLPDDTMAAAVIQAAFDISEQVPTGRARATPSPAPPETRQEYTPRTDEEEKSFNKALSNKVLARNPELAVAAVRLKNGEITAGEYADLVDVIDPFVAKGADPIPTQEKIKQYIAADKAPMVGAEIENGKEVEFRIDIPTYNRSTASGDPVYAITAHEPVAEDAKRVGAPISYMGVAKVINPTFMTRAISGKGAAIEIAMGAGKFPLATVKGNYEAITDLPTDINDPEVWTEVGYNPIRSSFFVDTRSGDAVVGGSEAIMVGSRVFVKNAQMEARPEGTTMGVVYAPEFEGEVPTFTEGTPEAATLKSMEASMAKVDAASEAKGGKPETYKISDIAANWMDQGGDERALQDAIVENTNLTPANAARVAKAIARQYDIQQSIATAFLETQTGLSVEALPEGVTLPKEVDPDRPKPVMQRLFEVFMGVRVPPTKITVNEKTALKQQIRLKAAANRAAKAAQKETSDQVIEVIKAMDLRGGVRPKQVQALAKRAAKVIWTNEKSLETFADYAAKVVENANYDADLREAKAAQKRAKELSKQKTVAASPQRQVLEDIGKISIGSIDDPRLFADTVNYYLRAFKRVTSPDYVVIPDSEMTSYLSQLENQEIDTNAERERVSNEKLAAQYGLPVSQVEALLNSQDIIRDLVAYAKREEIESILNQKIGDIQTALKAYDQNQLRPDQRKLVDSLLAIDAKGLDAKEKQSLIRIGNNVIYNNQTNGAQYFVAVANGQQNARQAAQDFKTIEKNRAWIDLIPTLGSKRTAETMRNWSLELQSVADTFRNIFGKENMAKIFRQMGMYNLDRGFTDAANTLDQIQEKMAEFYKKNTQKYKKAARDQNGILSEGVVGFLIQQVPAKGEAESIAQRRDLIKQDIANRRSSRQADKMEMADRIEEILGKVDGNTVEEILANMKASYRPNYDSLTYLMNDLLPQYKDFLKQFDENFNDQANNYDNPYYLPIAFIRSGPELEITPESESMFYEGMSLRPRQAANTIKRVDYSVLPKDKSGNPKEIQFNLRRGTYDSLSDQINKAYTNEAWQQIFSFMKTADADAVFGGRANKDFMAERLNRLRISRMRRGSANNGAISKFADSISVLARKIGTGIALGGVFQVFKQSPDQLISALGTTGRYDLLGEHVMTIGSAKKLLDKFSIGRRGDASSGYKYINQMEGAQNRLERAFTESRWSEVKENASKVADVWMLALKKTDFLCAASAWMTYYRANLDKNGIKFEGWDKEAQLVDEDPARQDAASYAEQMTDIYQGSSDPTKMATFAQSGKSGWENFVKAALVPFNSFAVQQRMRIYSDGRDSFTKAGETGALGRFGLASTIGGLVAFHTMRRLVLPTITGLGVYALYGMLGVDMDEPDDEKKKEEARKTWRQFQGELLANVLVGGAPQFVEAATIDAFNYANYLVSLQLESEDIIDDNGEIMDFAKYQKERSPFWRYQSFKNAPSFGMFDVGLGQAEKVAVQTKQLMDREQMEMYTPEEQRLLYFSTLSEWLYLMRLNDADLARMVGKARRDMIKAVEDREKQIKAIREGR